MFEGERVILALSIVMLKMHQSELREGKERREGGRDKERRGGREG